MDTSKKKGKEIERREDNPTKKKGKEIARREENPDKKKGKEKKGEQASGRSMALEEYTREQLNKFTTNLSFQIGRGNTSKVYQGEINEELIAVKVIQDDYIKRIQWTTEKECLSIIGLHPNIIRLRGFGDVGGQLFLVFEYMPHCLGKKFEGLDFDWKTTLKFLKQVGSALHHMHKCDPPLVFVDFKPDNILMDKDFNAKVSDFGSVKKKGSCVTTYTQIYAAPELQETGEATLQADIFSFGILLFQFIMKRDVGEELMSKPGERSNKPGGRSSERKGRAKGKDDEKEHIIDFATKKMKEGKNIVHKTLRDMGPQAEKEITELARQCTEGNPKARPLMDIVMQKLNDLSDNEKTLRANPKAK